MATYYSNSSNQREATPAMYIRDHGCTSYPETQVLPSNMIMYLNQSSSATSYSGGYTGNLPSIGASDSTPSQQGMGSSLISSNVGGQGYGVWRDRRNEMSFMQPMGGSANMQSDLCRDDEISQSIQIRFSEYLPPVSQGGNQNVMKGEVLGNLQSSTDPKSMSTLPNSKYLKVAQQLLDEVVNVRKALKRQDSDKKVSGETDGESKDGNVPPTTSMAPNTEESETNPTAEPSPAERQDLQNKVTKLLSMLDEVDRRYKQYYHQMQMLVSSFDVIAGNGASKPYTTLALQTISRHFRCLRDAITAQIKAIRTNLGEQDTVGNNTKGGISRLRFVDQQLRQQRALQHLGMMQQHAWRPQRGLPESSVSILRAWLFEHFLNPYPKDSEKITLARQTGLTRGQVANWFINARVRLWKPMIEDMYKEEFGETQLESNSSSENAPKAAKDAIVVPNEKEEELQQNIHSASTEQFYPGQSQELKFEVTHDAEVSRPTAGDFFQANRHEVETTNYAQTDMVSCSLPQDTLVHADGNGDGRFMDAATAYQMSELGRFGSHGGVSLTLGLQHFDNGGVPMSDAARENYVAMRGLDMYNAAAASVGPNAVDFNCIDPDNQRHRVQSPERAIASQLFTSSTEVLQQWQENINNKFMVPSVLQSPAPLCSSESMKAIKEEVLVQNARKWVDDISFGIKILEADRPFLWRFITDAEKYFSMFSLYEKDTTKS